MKRRCQALCEICFEAKPLHETVVENICVGDLVCLPRQSNMKKVLAITSNNSGTDNTVILHCQAMKNIFARESDICVNHFGAASKICVKNSFVACLPVSHIDRESGKIICLATHTDIAVEANASQKNLTAKMIGESGFVIGDVLMHFESINGRKKAINVHYALHRLHPL